MKKLLICSTIVIALLFSLGIAYGNTFTYTPIPNLGSLDHSYYYYWQITDPSLQSVLQNQKIVGATLTFTNIWDWTVESNDRLFIHLMNTKPAGGTPGPNPKNNVWRYFDNQPAGNVVGIDNFGTSGQMIGIWNDPAGGHARNYNLVFDLSNVGPNAINPDQNLLDELTIYAKDGIFGIAFDPDCHYYTSGVTFTITTQPIPEPGTLLLIGSGLVGLAFFSLRRTV